MVTVSIIFFDVPVLKLEQSVNEYKIKRLITFWRIKGIAWACENQVWGFLTGAYTDIFAGCRRHGWKIGSIAQYLRGVSNG